MDDQDWGEGGVMAMVRQVTAEGVETWTHVRAGETLPAELQMEEGTVVEPESTVRRLVLDLREMNERMDGRIDARIRRDRLIQESMAMPMRDDAKYDARVSADRDLRRSLWWAAGAAVFFAVMQVVWFGFWGRW